MTHELKGYYYDGQRSARQEASIVVEADGLVRSNIVALDQLHIEDIEISSRVGNTARYLDCGDMRRFETTDNATVDAICEQWKPAEQRLADKLERNMAVVFLAIVVTIAGGFSFVKWGIPALSGPITAMVPEALDKHLGDQTMELMVDRILDPSELKPARREALQARFDALQPEGRNYRLQFGRMEDIPNAFAVPNGTIVMTDDLVALSSNDEQLESIMLHEIGHLEERHSMQTLVQQSSLAIVITLITGDINAASALLLTLPAWLAEAQYSQALEHEADDYAYAQMQLRGMDTNAFASIMQKLEDSAREKKPDNISNNKQQNYDDTAIKILDYLSSHPPTAERIERFKTDSN